MCVAAPLVIFKEWKQSDCASVGELMNCGTSPQHSLFSNKKE